MVGALEDDLWEVLQKVNHQTDYKELAKLKEQIQTEVKSETDLNRKLEIVVRNMQRPLDDTELDFLMETFQGIHPRYWIPRNIATVARIFASSHAKCPIIVKTLMDVHVCDRFDDDFFEAVISACLGCIRCFDDIYIDYIVNKKGSELKTLALMCEVNGSKWVADANGCFAGYFSQQLTKDRCVGWFVYNSAINIIKKTRLTQSRIFFCLIGHL